MKSSGDAHFWEARWKNGQTGWDVGQPSPPLTTYLEQIPVERRAGLRILVPGCGNGHEALWMARNHFGRITMLDIAPTATEAMRTRIAKAGFEQAVSVVCGDFFTHEGQYDLILEQTFFCAITPDLRTGYVEQMSRLLAPGGKLIGVLFDRDFEGGPPFGGCAAEYETLFAPKFHILTLEQCANSIAPRAGSEVFIKMALK